MFHLVYLSTIIEPFPRERMLELLEEARLKNASLAITGMLLFKKGSVIQVLEGGEEQVRELFETIRRDPRHKGVTLIAEETVKERQFPGWAMAFHDVDAGTLEIPGYSDFLNISWQGEEMIRDPSLSKTLLNLFKWCLTDR